MAPVALLLLLLLLNVSACSGFGFRSCTQNYGDSRWMWCFNRGIVNISEVVRMFPENTTLINLSKNEIRAVPPGSFAHFAGLKHLDLNQNKLLFLRGEEFRGLHLMQFLNLSCNQISHIHSDTFKGLVSLNVLLLSQNNLSSVSGLLFNLLPAIQAVDLSFNALKSFSCEECGGSSTLEYLNVSVNHIQEVNVSCFPALKYIKLSNNSELELQPDVFESNQQLRTLLLVSVKLEALMGLSPQTKRNLSHVSFSMLAEKSPWTICDVLRGMDHISKVQVDLKGSKLPQSNVSLLDCPTPTTLIFMEAKLGNVARLSSGRRSTSKLCLTNCGLKQISNSTFEGFAALKTLCLDKNAVVIEPDAFRGMTTLRSLNLDRNRIRDIDPRWFLPLKTLTQLSLMKNEITELEPSVFHALTQLEQLYLQFNLLKSLKNRTFSNLFKLQRLSLSLNIICFIEPGTFQDLKNLRFLDLSGNRLKRVTPYILSGLDTLVHLILYNNRLQFRSYESPFIQLTSLEYLEMRYQGPGGGIGDIGPDFFKGLQKLRCINIGNSVKMNIHADAFAPLTSLKILYIDGVVLKDINLTAVLFPLKSLSKLMLNMADLDTLPANLLPPNNSLRILQVSSNHIHTLNKELLDNLPGLVYFDISQNPLSCTCDNSWFKTWATNNAKTQVVYLYNLRCDNNRSSRHLWQFDDKACSYDQISLMLFITCSTTDVLLVFACLVWHTQGPALRLLLLMAKAKLRGRKKGAGAKFQYDAFISYNSRDEDWVMGQLVPNLERPAPGAQRLKLCLHHRDFRPGAAVLENIEAAIYGSRHTICVVTRSYLQSDWCSVEFQLASLRLLCDGSDVLLLVFLEEIPERCLSPYTRLRRIVHKKTYLLWPENPQEQEAFWVRLMDALRDREESKEAGEIGGEQRLAP
ncbi:toll-like receptor 13 [Fundulus heteroclitus]|uniref:toll-like receptor 13 n=1 Tax=Fundulus heteroclitus TaxID=8078 RepID=UPI00165CD6FF|nr:toll-like receptor 13 [Fundulus heteroclitus]